MDLQQILKTSRVFYRDHGLQSWRAALPKTAHIDDPDKTLADIAKCGFDRGFAFPSFALQMATIDDLIEETARKPSPALSDSQQYGSDVVLSDTWTKEPTGKILQRTDDLSGRAEGPYFLLFQANPSTMPGAERASKSKSYFKARIGRASRCRSILSYKRAFSRSVTVITAFTNKPATVTPNTGFGLWTR